MRSADRGVRIQVTISQRDIQQLIQEPSPEVRAGIAAKVSEGFNRSRFTENESRVAIDIFRLLLRDTAHIVRKAIAEELKTNEYVPHDIIRALANDVPDIALGIIESSTVLTDDDLEELIKATGNIDKWMAVSRRKTVSARVSRALVETANAQVVSSLLNNSNAEIGETDIEKIAEEYRGDQSVMEALICRGGLSTAFAEKLFALMADQFKRVLTRRYRLSWALANKTTDVAREMSVLRFLIPWMRPYEMEELVRTMKRNKRLHYSLVVRALCLGEVGFFEQAMAALAEIPVENARTLMLDAGPLGFHALYDTCGMPAGFAEAIKTLYHFSLLETNDGNKRIRDFQRRMIDRLTNNGYHESVENMSYFIAIMRQNANESVTLH